MFVCCEICGYDSGDADDTDELARRVKADGGGFEQTVNGCVIKCPAGHGGDAIHLD